MSAKLHTYIYEANVIGEGGLMGIPHWGIPDALLITSVFEV